MYTHTSCACACACTCTCVVCCGACWCGAPPRRTAPCAGAGGSAGWREAAMGARVCARVRVSLFTALAERALWARRARPRLSSARALVGGSRPSPWSCLIVTHSYIYGHASHPPRLCRVRPQPQGAQAITSPAACRSEPTRACEAALRHTLEATRRDLDRSHSRASCGHQRSSREARSHSAAASDRSHWSAAKTP